MDDAHKEDTNFACNVDLEVMPFGLANAQAVFQDLMVTALSG